MHKVPPTRENDDDVKGDDDKKNSFKEDDIIKYMHQRMDDRPFLLGRRQNREAAGTAYARLERRIIEAGIRHRAFVKSQRNQHL